MKNRIFYTFLILIIFFQDAFAEKLNIKSSSITLDKQTQITVFNKNVIATDEKNNILKSDFAEYDKNLQILISKGKTEITTSEGFIIFGEDIIFNNSEKIISSKKPANIKDLENNNIYLDNFEYSTKNNFFKASGKIKVIDTRENTYNFSQIFIDEKKREIVGTDVKSFINQENFKINKNNKPRIFANTVNVNKKESNFTKSVFTLCDYRKDDKCPPWSLQAKSMKHDSESKTIYYDNAILKVYDIPIFYFPKLSHPDPTVDRRSGFLPPAFSDTKNLGPGFEIPYYWAINKDKDITLTSKIFSSEHPLFLGEYRQAFRNSNLILDAGFTEGYKKTSSIKRSGEKSHFFAKYVKNFVGKNDSDNIFELNLQDLSNDKYLKLYKINSELVDYENDTIENSLNFIREDDNAFFALSAISYETLKENYNDKYEFILPEIDYSRNLFSNNKLGYADLQSNLKIHNYDTNKYSKFVVNDIDWKFKNFNFSSGLSGRILGKIKNVNYETKNISDYKDEPTSELFGALGYLTEINLYKNNQNSVHLLNPKLLFKFAPDYMRKENSKIKLNHLNVFNLDRLDSPTNFESGLNATIVFDYELNTNDKRLTLSAGQIISEKENKNMPSSSSLDEKLSDVVGNADLKINENLSINYNFALDQNYKDLNYNEIGTNLNFEPFKIKFNYLEEKEHIGNQEYLESSFEFAKGNNGFFSFKNKRNLITNSSEYYDLSYEYINDCLRAGLVYRREFYNDSELESENSLMFKITLVPFGNINSPSFSN